MGKSEIQENLRKHIDEAPGREVEALYLSKLSQPLRMIKKLMWEAELRNDKASLGILKALGMIWIHRGA